MGLINLRLKVTTIKWQVQTHGLEKDLSDKSSGAD